MARWSVGKNSMSVEQPEKETECRPVRTQIDPLFWANVRVADPDVSHLSREKRGIPGVLARARSV
jgi:hypothetical protein